MSGQPMFHNIQIATELPGVVEFSGIVVCHTLSRGVVHVLLQVLVQKLLSAK